MLRIGETIDRYTVEALIGQGGMAAVYRAKHNALDSLHAVKILFITAPAIRRRLMQEGKVQANLRHPNIVAVTDVLEIQGAPALVMEYVAGPALDQWLQEHEPTLDEALFLFKGILRGVMAAHERGVIHRDLKPANVMLAPSNEGLVPKVTDFGLVKSLSDQRGKTQTGMAMGTPEYMAPEQIRDASDVDQRVDMFALGCILYELVCHRRAFEGPDNVTIFNAIVEGKYAPPRKFTDNLPRNVLMAIRWLLESDREKRLGSAMELFDLLYEESTVGRLESPKESLKPIHISNITEQPMIYPAEDPVQLSSGQSTPPQASVVMAPPAHLRSSTPRRGAGTPAPAQYREDQPDSALRTLMVLIPIVTVLLVGVLVGSASSTMWGERPLPAPTGTQLPLPMGRVGVELNPTPVNAVPVPAADPVPTVADPVPQPQQAVPRPQQPVPRPQQPVSQPQPPVPQPAEVVPVPEPEPAAAAGASVSLTGDGKGAVLEGGGKKYTLPGSVPAGSYKILGDFGQGLVPAGQAVVRDGKTVVIDCQSFFSQCTQK